MSDAPFTDAKQLTAETAATGRKFAADATDRSRILLDQASGQLSRTRGDLGKAGEEATAMARANLEAFARSTQIWVEHLQASGQHGMTTMQALAEQAGETSKAVVHAKSLKEAAALQGAFLRSALDRVLAGQAKLQAMTMKAAETAFAPLGERVAAGLDRAARAPAG